jgi:hypothetical protein
MNVAQAKREERDGLVLPARSGAKDAVSNVGIKRDSTSEGRVHPHRERRIRRRAGQVGRHRYRPFGASRQDLESAERGWREDSVPTAEEGHVELCLRQARWYELVEGVQVPNAILNLETTHLPRRGDRLVRVPGPIDNTLGISRKAILRNESQLEANKI